MTTDRTDLVIGAWAIAMVPRQLVPRQLLADPCERKKGNTTDENGKKYSINIATQIAPMKSGTSM